MCTFIRCIRTSWSCALLYTVEGSSPGPSEAGGDGGGAGFLGSSGAFVVDCWNTLGERSNDIPSPGTTRPALVWNETKRRSSHRSRRKTYMWAPVLMFDMSIEWNSSPASTWFYAPAYITYALFPRSSTSNYYKPNKTWWLVYTRDVIS